MLVFVISVTLSLANHDNQPRYTAWMFSTVWFVRRVVSRGCTSPDYGIAPLSNPPAAPKKNDTNRFPVCGEDRTRGLHSVGSAEDASLSLDCDFIQQGLAATRHGHDLSTKKFPLTRLKDDS